MELYTLIAPCHFGMEAVLKREIVDLGYEITQVEDGRVSFEADAEGICRSNIWLRTAERVLLEAGSFEATSFNDLFDETRAIPWEKFIPQDGHVWVTKAASVKSKLYSASDIQSIVKKAIVERLKEAYHTELIPETGSDYPLRVFINKDQVTIGIDTTGESLHKRGYRKNTVAAPISETLAAALILLTPWKKDRVLVDPFCGSGTFVIEAAMIAANMAPGLNRHFLSEHWDNLIPKKEWYGVFDEAGEMVEMPDPKDVDIQGYDIDRFAVAAARDNAKLAGVESLIHFQVRDVAELHHPKKYGFLISNPPYGERLEDQATLPAIYRALGARFRDLDSWSAYLITSYTDTEKYIGRKADKKRKLYNGMIKTDYYQFIGPKPPKRTEPKNEGPKA